MIATRSFSNSSRVIRALITGAPGSGKGTISSRIVRDFGLVHLSSGDVLRLHVKEQTDLGIKAKEYIEKGKLVPDDLMVELMINEVSSHPNKGWLLDGFPRTIGQAESLDKKQKFDIVIHLDVPFSEIKRRIEQRYVHVSSGRVYHLEWNPPKNPGVDDVTGEPLIQRDDDKADTQQLTKHLTTQPAYTAPPVRRFYHPGNCLLARLCENEYYKPNFTQVLQPETVDARLKVFQTQMDPLLDFYGGQGILKTFSGTESNVIYPQVKAFLDKQFCQD